MSQPPPPNPNPPAFRGGGASEASSSSSSASSFSSSQQQQQGESVSSLMMMSTSTGGAGAFALLPGTPLFPMMAYLRFCPGGISYSHHPAAAATSSDSADSYYYPLHQISANTTFAAAMPSTAVSGSSSPLPAATAASSRLGLAVGANVNSSSSLASSPSSAASRTAFIDVLVHRAKLADERLRQYALLYASQQQPQLDPRVLPRSVPHVLPSLSCLAEQAFHRLTGCPPSAAKEWADAMVLQYCLPVDSTEKDLFCAALAAAHVQANAAAAAQQQQNADSAMMMQDSSDSENPFESILVATLKPEWIPRTDEDIYNTKPVAMMKTIPSSSMGPTFAATTPHNHTAAQYLKQFFLKSEQVLAETIRAQSAAPGGDANAADYKPRRPCGYVFKRGDIAWNCRTCQTDATCVICDDCFRHSSHDGHEVYFHRTTPGGCCDCGDVEAWKWEGCCDRHRPASNPAESANNASPVQSQQPFTPSAATAGSSAALLLGKVANDDPMEAVRMARKGLSEGMEVLVKPPTALPPRLTAALGVVVGAAVQCLVDAVDGAGVGADPVQWKMRWADEAARIVNGTVCRDDYFLESTKNEIFATPTSFLDPIGSCRVLPEGYRLHLRLHNDDVHTFDEVIDALHEPRPMRRSNSNMPVGEDPSLVPRRENAVEMTQHVDADGQVTIKTYSTIAHAMQGFRRLKSRGLHCSVVSTAQVQAEFRARAMAQWLAEIAAAHPAAAVLVVHALVQVMDASDRCLAGVHVWRQSHMIPSWAGMMMTMMTDSNLQSWNFSDTSVEFEMELCRRRFEAFPPHLPSSYVTREEAELLHGIALTVEPSAFCGWCDTIPTFYATVPYRLPSERYMKSPHALWGTLPGLYSDPLSPTARHPLLQRLMQARMTGGVPAVPEPTNRSLRNRLTESVFVVDTDLRKQQEADRITTSVYPHRLPGLHMISGAGTIRMHELDARRPPLPNTMDMRHLLATSSFRAPMSPLLLLLLLDPYPTKQVRGAIHALFLSLMIDARFKCRFAGALAVAYRPLSTLFCAGVGTEADTPLHFTVQIFTAGSLMRALGHGPATEKLLLSDQDEEDDMGDPSMGVFVSPIAHVIVRCIHTNLLGATKEVSMILANTTSGSGDASQDEDNPQTSNENLLPALTYVAGEHPLMTPLPAAPDDGFLDSRSTRHKRLPHLLRDLEYVIETPGTAIRLLLPQSFPVYQGPSLSFRGENVLSFPAVFARMLRLAQGMDPQKRKISGGHVEYEQNRWLEAFGLSLNFAGARDALAECPTSSNNGAIAVTEDGSHLAASKEAIGNFIAALLREVKLWLYREGMLETGLPIPPGGPHGASDIAQAEALQRSTLHVSSSQFSTSDSGSVPTGGVSTVALSCAVGVKMTEAQLTLIENALKVEAAMRIHRSSLYTNAPPQSPSSGPVIGDWLRVPHTPLTGDSLSFHLPLHRALAKCVQSVCSVIVPDVVRETYPNDWWKLPVLDDYQSSASPDTLNLPQHPLVPLIRPTLRTSNCRVVWSSGPDCTPQEAQKRRSRSRGVSANIAVAKIIHSLADHPIRCLSASLQIEQHLWARNGSSVAGMALNYSSTPLCRSFRDLDLLLVQLSASGMSCGLGARRVFSLLLSRFSMDGYLCDPERRSQPTSTSDGAVSFGSSLGVWVNPPRLQDPDQAIILSEAFFSIICVLVSELPSPPPISTTDDISLRSNIRRELLHALATESRSHSEAMTAASRGISRREDGDGSPGGGGGAGLFRKAFSAVLKEIGKQKNTSSSRAGASPASFELKPDFCDEYDPTFYHLRRQEHQHAMDVVARLRKQKWGDDKDAYETHCLPIVCVPPKAHPRFLPCRLLLHLDLIDAAIRRSLLFALTNGSWLPPPEPQRSTSDEMALSTNSADGPNALAPHALSMEAPGSVSRLLRSQSSSGSYAKRGLNDNSPAPFSQEVVAASSVSFLEVLQLLTLQVHTLEDCASLHRMLPDLDDEARALSSGVSINSYLRRLVYVPSSLVDVWALRPAPHGPLPSKGSGQKRGSILGLLVALYEHRSDHGVLLDNDGGEYTDGDAGHGGARSLASSGLKWLLRFVHSLVMGAPSVSSAVKSATTGSPLRSPAYSSLGDSGSSLWTIDESIRSTISQMLANLPDLWPKIREEASSSGKGKDTGNSKEAGRLAQKRLLEMMKKKQAAFAATITPSDDPSGGKTNDLDEESDLCIICKCDDADGENNGPLGFLGHVQRSRVAQMRATLEASQEEESKSPLVRTYRVVGHMGCQLRETEAMDSRPLTCLPKGSVVIVRRTKITTQYGIQSRRVLVRHMVQDSRTKIAVLTEGWASIQSSQGYVILSPLVSLCYGNSRWGCTRPIIKQCGHAAHLKCVETHTLSLHQRAAGEQTYDGRFAANIVDGEFLCPLCKQLSNILIPRDAHPSISGDKGTLHSKDRSLRDLFATRLNFRCAMDSLGGMGKEALEDFGSHLYNAMSVSWDRSGALARKKQIWNSSVQKWDYEEDSGEKDEGIGDKRPSVGNLLRLLRQQLIAWAAVGHSAGASEAGARGIEEAMPFGVLSQTSDPWSGFDEGSRDSNPMMLELKRTLTGTSGLLHVVSNEISKQLGGLQDMHGESYFICGAIVDILEGNSWIGAVPRHDTDSLANKVALWSELSALTAAMPCHVARDGTIPQRCEARATSVAMWSVRGHGSLDESAVPPQPLAIRQLFLAQAARNPPIESGWGTMEPFLDPNVSYGDRSPFRLGIASAFLYTPLLAWDLNTFAGSVFSCVLCNNIDELPRSGELLGLARTLLVARLIQAVTSPGGVIIPDDMDLDDEECWSQQELEAEGLALAKLVAHCRYLVASQSLELAGELMGDPGEYSGAGLLAGAGRSILPFARSLVLILRSCSAAIRDRQQRAGVQSSLTPTDSDKFLNSLILNDELMSVEDGFFLLKAAQCINPVTLIDKTGMWWSLINRWLGAAIGLELHHGSSGRTVISASIRPPDHPMPEVKQGMKIIEVSKSSAASYTSSAARLSEAAMDEDDEDDDNDNADDGMDVDDGENGEYSRLFAGARRMRPDFESPLDEDSDEIVEDTDMDLVNDVGFDESRGMNAGGNQVASSEEGELLDDCSSSASEGETRSPDREFAHVSRSPILYYQPSFFGISAIGPGQSGSTFDFATAAAVMSDLSHMGIIHRKDIPTFCLIRLPKSFVELYNLVNKVKGRDEATAGDDSDDATNAETAICLLTGSVMRSGSARPPFARGTRPPGACTLHARKKGSGIGIFFLVQKCTVLLMHNNKSAYSPSLYVDEHGEEDPGLRRGRPLFLNDARYRALELLWRQQGIPREVAQIRSTSDRVIRDNWY